jgi:hypothetical protein
MPTDTVPITVTTHYETLDSDRIDCVDFVGAVECGLNEVPKYTVVERDESGDYFCVHLGFAKVDDRFIAVSAVLTFHKGGSRIGYFLRQWTGHSTTANYEESASILVSALHEEIQKQVELGWLK